jgi:hypothetical protein
MLPSRLPRPIRLSLFALAVAILFLLCVLPSDALPDPGTGERFEHSAAWFVLTATGHLLAPRRVLAIPAFALAYGVFIEVVQGFVGRDSDVRDVVADAVGVALAAGLFLAGRRWRAAR